MEKNFFDEISLEIMCKIFSYVSPEHINAQKAKFAARVNKLKIGVVGGSEAVLDAVPGEERVGDSRATLVTTSETKLNANVIPKEESQPSTG